MAPTILLMLLAGFMSPAGSVPVVRAGTSDLDATGAVGAAPIKKENMVRRELATAPHPRGHSALQVGARAELKKPPMPEDLEVASMLDNQAENKNLFPATGTVYGQAYYGNAGPKGAKGLNGPQGPVGISGEAGDTGLAASLTAAYVTFLQNTSAFQGPRGPTGPRGIEGDPGEMGFKGFVGQQGPPGLPGSFTPDQQALFKQVVTSMQSAIINMENQHAASQTVLDSQIQQMEKRYNESQTMIATLENFLANVSALEEDTENSAKTINSVLTATNTSIVTLLNTQANLYANLHSLYEQELRAANAQAAR